MKVLRKAAPDGSMQWYAKSCLPGTACHAAACLASQSSYCTIQMSTGRSAGSPPFQFKTAAVATCGHRVLIAPYSLRMFASHERGCSS